MATPLKPVSQQKPVPWKRIFVTAGVAFTILVLAGAYRVGTSHGVFAPIPESSTAACSYLAGVPGVNDIALDEADGIAFLSVTDQRAHHAGRTVSSDGIYAYAYKIRGAKPVKLAGTPKSFHPHALAVARADDGSMTLYALNYGANHTHSVDSFAVTVQDGKASLKELSVAMSGLMVSPHAIATVGNGYYYLTNDHVVTSDAGRWMDDNFVLPRSDILYFDGTKFTIAAQKVNFPSGIVVSPDGNHVYVAERYARKLVTFERDPFRGRLKKVDTMKLPANPGKLTLGPDGNLWLAATPKPYAAAAYRKDATKKAPSLVWRITLTDGVPQVLDQVFADDGSRFSAPDVAGEAGGKLLIGSGFANKLAVCAEK